MAQYYHFWIFRVRQNNASLFPSDPESVTAEIKHSLCQRVSAKTAWPGNARWGLVSVVLTGTATSSSIDFAP
jgi:hypothetical protein